MHKINGNSHETILRVVIAQLVQEPVVKCIAVPPSVRHLVPDVIGPLHHHFQLLLAVHVVEFVAVLQLRILFNVALHLLEMAKVVIIIKEGFLQLFLVEIAS